MVMTPSPVVFNPSQEMTKRALEVRYYCDHTQLQVGFHSHSFYEVYYFLEGSLECYVVNGKSYRLRPGDILVIPPELMHYPVFQGDAFQPYRRYVLWISTQLAEQMTALDPDLISVFSTCRDQEDYLVRGTIPSVRRQMEDYLAEMWREEENDTSCKQAYLYGLCLHFMATLNRMVAEGRAVSVSRSHSDILLDMVLAYIHKNYVSAISLQQVADSFYTSPSNIESLFHKRLQRPFYRYVTECRIFHAQKLIAGGMPMKEVGIACGYSDYSNFYRAFTKVSGISPSKFRQNLYPDISERDRGTTWLKKV